MISSTISKEIYLTHTDNSADDFETFTFDI